MKLKKLTACSLLIMLISLPVLAAPKVQINLDAKKVILENKKEKMVTSDSVKPGDTLAYTLRVANIGDSPALKLEPVGDIPANTVYLPDLKLQKEFKILFSTDGGKTFQIKPMLKVKEKGRDLLKPAPIQSYNKIKWQVESLPAGKTLELNYRVKVK